MDAHADYLVVVIDAVGERLGLLGQDGELLAAQRLGLRAVGDGVQLEQQAALGRAGALDAGGLAPDVEDAAGREPVGRVGQRLNADIAAQAPR